MLKYKIPQIVTLTLPFYYNLKTNHSKKRVLKTKKTAKSGSLLTV